MPVSGYQTHYTICVLILDNLSIIETHVEHVKLVFCELVFLPSVLEVVHRPVDLLGRDNGRKAAAPDVVAEHDPQLGMVALDGPGLVHQVHSFRETVDDLLGKALLPDHSHDSWLQKRLVCLDPSIHLLPTHTREHLRTHASCEAALPHHADQRSLQ